jgi:hypothetical protein
VPAGRSHRGRRALLAASIACLGLALAIPAGAGAATGIGPNPPVTSDPLTIQSILWPPGVVLVNLTAPSDQTLLAPASGVITSTPIAPSRLTSIALRH